MESHASRLRLRGARRHVLTAVLTLLCGWSRITDDAVRLAQLAEVITAGGGRRYDLKTIGRALTQLQRYHLIVYRPAQGRGTRALIAIHDRFVADIEILPRDSSGQVVTDSVTFSDRTPYIHQTTYLPTLRGRRARMNTRPAEVQVHPADVRQVLNELPPVFAALPKHLRWRLGGEIRTQLAAGWRPDQILDVLGAPLPANVQRPWRLALWRLRHNMIGAGPRLRPLQRAWDRQASQTARAAADEATARWYGAVVAATTDTDRETLLRADTAKYGRRSVDPIAALAHAGRIAARMFPGTELADALRSWAAEVLGSRAGTGEPEAQPAVNSTASDLVADLAIGAGACLVCGSVRAVPRPELPLKSTVCDRCWAVMAPPELQADNHLEDLTEVVPP